MIDYLEYLCDKFPIVSIEDGLNDWDGWAKLTQTLGDRTVIGDDICDQFSDFTRGQINGCQLYFD